MGYFNMERGDVKEKPIVMDKIFRYTFFESGVVCVNKALKIGNFKILEKNI